MAPRPHTIMTAPQYKFVEVEYRRPRHCAFEREDRTIRGEQQTNRISQVEVHRLPEQDVQCQCEREDNRCEHRGTLVPSRVASR